MAEITNETEEIKTSVEFEEKETIFNKVKNTVKNHKVIAITAVAAAGMYVAAKVGAAFGRSQVVDFDDVSDDTTDEFDDPVEDVEVEEED